MTDGGADVEDLASAEDIVRCVPPRPPIPGSLDIPRPLGMLPIDRRSPFLLVQCFSLPPAGASLEHSTSVSSQHYDAPLTDRWDRVPIRR